LEKTKIRARPPPPLRSVPSCLSSERRRRGRGKWVDGSKAEFGGLPTKIGSDFGHSPAATVPPPFSHCLSPEFK